MKILLYSPTMVGHPQLYCRVLSHILVNEGHKVVVAGSGLSDNWPNEFPDLFSLIGKSEVEFIDTRSYSGRTLPRLTVEELRTLQSEFCIDSTLFVEGDYFSDQFRRIADREAPRLHGRTSAIFSHTSRWFPNEDAYSGERQSNSPQTLRQAVGQVRRATFHRRQSDKYFFETVLIKRKVIDNLIVKDERILEKHGDAVHCMPEIFRVFDNYKAAELNADVSNFSEPIRKYIEMADSRNVLLYFGAGRWYKGYDYFLKLAELDHSTFALHVGGSEKLEKGKLMTFDTDALRISLREQGRLFETDTFIESPLLVQQVFDSVDRFVSTHRLTLSSGTMLQALQAGKPVLVPDTGLVGWRTRKFGLGQTYKYLDESDLVRSWREFKEQPVDQYHPNIENFMRRFSKTAVRNFFLTHLCGNG